MERSRRISAANFAPLLALFFVVSLPCLSSAEDETQPAAKQSAAPAAPAGGPLSVKLPTGLTVELAGVTPNRKPSRDGWFPNGQSIGKIENWPKGHLCSGPFFFDDPTGPYNKPNDYSRDLLLRFSQGIPESSYAFRGEFEKHVLPSPKDGLRFRASALMKEKHVSSSLEIYFTDAAVPWGKYQKVDLDGNLLNEIKPGDPHSAYYRRVRAVRRAELDLARYQNEDPKLVLRIDTDIDHLIQIDVRGFDKQGKEFTPERYWSKSSSTKNNIEYTVRENGYCRELDYPDDSAWLEFRIRPYGHVARFENIAMQPGRLTTPRATLQPIADLQLESKADINKRVFGWLRTLTSGPTAEKAQAARDVENWALFNRPESINPLLIRSLIRKFGQGEIETPLPVYGKQKDQPLGFWCQQAVLALGRPAIPELIDSLRRDPPLVQMRALECLARLKPISPEGIDAIIATLPVSDKVLREVAHNTLRKLSDDPAVATKLIAAAKAPSKDAQVRALEALAVLPGDLVEQALIKGLDSPHREAQHEVLLGLLAHPRPRAASALIAHLRADDSEHARLITQILQKTANESLDVLLTGSISDKDAVRAACLAALPRALPEAAARVMPTLTTALRDRDPKQRALAMEIFSGSCWYYDREPVLAALLENIQHPDREVRSKAVLAASTSLVRWGRDARLAPIFREVLQKSRSAATQSHKPAEIGEFPPEILLQTFESIKRLRDSSIVPILIEIAGSRSPLSVHAQLALGNIGDPRGIKFLRTAGAKLEPYALFALAECGDRQSVPLFITALQNSDATIRSVAMKALQQVPDPRATPTLLKILNQEGLLSDFGSGSYRDLSAALAATGTPEASRAMISRIDAANRVSLLRESKSSRINLNNYESELRGLTLVEPLSSMGGPAFPELLQGLTSKSLLTRQACAYVLSRISRDHDTLPSDLTPFRDGLLTALYDPDPVVRILVIKTIGQLRIRAAEPLLVALIFDKKAPRPELVQNRPHTAVDHETQVELIQAMSSFKSEPVREVLMQGLIHYDHLKAASAEHLGSFPPDRSSQIIGNPFLIACFQAVAGTSKAGYTKYYLINALTPDKNGMVQANAAKSLGELGYPEAIPPLRQLLHRIPATVWPTAGFHAQARAAVSLTQLHDAAGTKRLRELLLSKDGSTLQVVTHFVRSAYGRQDLCGGRLSHEPTRAMLREFVERESSHYMPRRTILEALGEQLDSPTRALVEKLASNQHTYLQGKALLMLAAENPARYETRLLELLDGRAEPPPSEVIPLLARIPGEKVTARLIELTNDPFELFRFAAIKSLARRTEPSAIARLQELSTDPRGRVRAVALRTLQSRQRGKVTAP